jgi:hypothetical protein
LRDELMQRQSPPTKPDRTPPAAVARPRTELELDQAFLHWFESRLANSGPEPAEEHVLDYLVAWALCPAS